MVFISRYLTDGEVRASLEHYAKLLDQREEALDRREVELRQQSDQRVALLNRQEESLRRREEVLVAKESEMAEGGKSKGQQVLQASKAAPPPQRTLLQRQPNFREMAAAGAAHRITHCVPPSSSSRVVGGVGTSEMGVKDKKKDLARMQKTLGHVPNEKVNKVAAGGVSKESKKTLKREKPKESKPRRDDSAVGEGSPKKRRHLPFNAFFSANAERFREEASRHAEMGARAAIRLAAREWSQLDDKSPWMEPNVAVASKSGSGGESSAGNE